MSFYFTVPVFKWELIDYFKKMYIKSSATCGYILIQVISLGTEVYSEVPQAKITKRKSELTAISMMTAVVPVKCLAIKRQIMEIRYIVLTITNLVKVVESMKAGIGIMKIIHLIII